MKQFKHGDLVTVADLNAMVTAINNIETQSQMSAYVFGSRDAVLAGTQFYGLHNKRWLIYRSTGKIIDPDEPTNEDKHVSLPDCNAEFCAYDLHAVGWLTYGKLYMVQGSEFALEADSNA